MDRDGAVSARAVQALAESSDVAKAFFERLANRSNNSRQTTVERVMRFTRGTRRDVVELFKKLEALELGIFKPGRRGAQSRFEWHVRLKDVGQAAIGEVEEIEPATQEELSELDDEVEEDLEMLVHEYTLRAGLKVAISLPADLTVKEAERVAMFIQTLPFEE